MEEKLLNIEEVAKYLGLSEKAVKELVGKGGLPAYKIGGVILRFKKEQVESYHRRLYAKAEADFVSSRSRTVKSDFEFKGAYKKHPQAGRNNEPSDMKYTFLERLADFLYYNDFYILSFILSILVLLAVFGF